MLLKTTTSEYGTFPITWADFTWIIVAYMVQARMCGMIYGSLPRKPWWNTTIRSSPKSVIISTAKAFHGLIDEPLSVRIVRNVFSHRTSQPGNVRKYYKSISGPLLDRIDVHIVAQSYFSLSLDAAQMSNKTLTRASRMLCPSARYP